jgi:UDP-N-acetylmuramate dehydrogenase
MQDRLANHIGADVQCDVPLREHTTLRIGGPARYYCAVDRAEQLAAAFAAAKAEGLEALLLGGGSNLLVRDGGFDGLVVHNRVTGIDVHGRSVAVGSGEPFHGLIERAAASGLAGLGFAAGVPGTVGGAVFGNAGCYGEAIGDRLAEVVLVGPDGTDRRAVAPAELAFRYRHSDLKRTGAVIESITLTLDEGDPDTLRDEIAGHLETRENKHPVDLPSAGSYFKNLPPQQPGGRRVAAGLLLDRCGCKGLRVGDAGVFERHANIIVNLGSASAKDVQQLAHEMKRRVRRRFDVTLVEEVRHVGHDA